MSSDISLKGIGFVCDETVTSNYVRISIVEDNFSAIGIVRHTRQVEEQGQHFVGVEFLDEYFCHER